MKAKKVVAFVLAMLIIVAMAVVVFGDVTIFGFRVPGVLDPAYGVKQGLDLRGGSSFVLKPEVADGVKVTEDDMLAAESIIRVRLDSMNYKEAVITRQGDNYIRVEIPDVKDPNEAVEIIGSTAELKFLDADYNVVMDGNNKMVKSAVAMYGKTTEFGEPGHYVQLTLTNEGRETFKIATRKAAAQPEGRNVIHIALDNQIMSSPMVETMIDQDTCVINGLRDAEYAEWLADVITSGRLPHKLVADELRSTGPTLGQEALSTSIFAALIGVILVMLFMLLVYRLPGLVADISLVAYISIVCLVMAGFFVTDYRTTLTLSGIAGVILSIGMAVDANVVIFERIKDELNSGKSVGASVDSGFKRALTAIIDSNVTTIISCAVLFFVGTGTVKGFAETLFIGVVVSLLTAVFLTKFLLKLILGFGVKNPWFYGASKRRDA